MFNFEQSAVSEKLRSLVKNNLFPLFLGLLSLIFFVYGLISLLGNSRNEAENVIFEAGKNSTGVENENTEESQKIVVDVGGAVVKPGVYALPFGARVKDALIAANGLASDADRNWIEKNMNMAAKIVDGEKIYLPKIGSLQSGNGNNYSNSGKININLASEKELDSLPGIGPVTVEKIIESRPYSQIDDLLTKKIVGSKVFGEIRDRISVY